MSIGVADTSLAADPKHIWMVKPTFIGIVSASLFGFILVGLAIAAGFGASTALPSLPIAGFLLVRATITATSPTPRNFHTAQGQLHFLASQAQSLSTLCFSYSILKFSILAVSNAPNNEADYSDVATLVTSGAFALSLMIVGLLQVKQFARAAQADEKLSNSYLLLALLSYAASALLSSVYIVSIVPVVEERTVVEWLIASLPSTPLFGVTILAVLSVTLLGNITVKSIMNIVSLLRTPGYKASARAIESLDDQEVILELPVLPTLAIKVLSEAFGKGIVATALIFIGFIVVGGIVAAFMGSVWVVGAGLPQVGEVMSETVLWAGYNPWPLLIGFTVIAVGLIAVALFSQWPVLVAKVSHSRMVIQKRNDMERENRLLNKARRELERFLRTTEQIREQAEKKSAEAAGRDGQINGLEATVQTLQLQAAAATAEYQRAKTSQPKLPRGKT